VGKSKCFDFPTLIEISQVPINVFHVWDFPAVSTVQQHHFGQVHTDFASCYVQNSLTQNVSFISPQPHNSTMDIAEI